MLHAPALFLSVSPRSASTSLVETVTIGASVAIGASVFLLAVIFSVLWKRVNRKRQDRQYNVVDLADLKRPQRPQRPTIRTDTGFPAEMKPAYLDSPRPRRTSVIVAGEPNQLLSPLMASQQSGFMPRPVPANVPIDVPLSRVSSMRVEFNADHGHSRSASMKSKQHSRATSMKSSKSHRSRTASGQFNPHYSLGVPPEDLAELLEDLSRHYVLADSNAPRPMQGHRHSSSLTGRSRGEYSYE
jgi:hypothetical protein